MGLKRLKGEPSKRKKFVHKKAKVTEPEQLDQTPIAPAPIEDHPTMPASSPIQTKGQFTRLAPNEESPSDHTFDMNAPYGKNIPAIDEGVLSQGLAKQMHLVAEELNLARSIQISAGVPLHESVKIALETLLSVSYHVALISFFFFFSLFFL